MNEIGIKVNLPLDDEIGASIGKIRETLSRLGIANKQKKIMYPSCYLYEDGDDFYIAHFKELFPLVNDYGENEASDEDITRRDMIIKLLGNWGLIEEVDEVQEADKFIFVLPFKEKYDWKITHKINFRKLNN
jgi:hypothetical protein